MIIHGISPTDDVSAVSVQQVFNRINIRSYDTLIYLLRTSLKYISYHEVIDDEDEALFQENSNKYRLNQSLNRIDSYHKRLMMPLDTANRLINDFKNGLILQKAERV